MKISFIERLTRLFKATAHDTLDNLEDPGAIARQMVRDLSVEIAKHEEAVAAVIGDQKVLEKKRDEAKKEADEWNAKAEQAVLAKRDDLALAALERAGRAEASFKAFEKSLAILSPKVEALKAKRAELCKMRDDAEHEAEMLDARAKAANASSRVARILGDVGSNPVDFNSVRERVDKIEARAEALNELAQDPAMNIEAELAAITTTPAADRLAALKASIDSGSQETR